MKYINHINDDELDTCINNTDGVVRNALMQFRDVRPMLRLLIAYFYANEDEQHIRSYCWEALEEEFALLVEKYDSIKDIE